LYVYVKALTLFVERLEGHPADVAASVSKGFPRKNVGNRATQQTIILWENLRVEFSIKQTSIE